jgi:hypothetical protein
MRSRVTANDCPTSSSVCSGPECFSNTLHKVTEFSQILCTWYGGRPVVVTC